MRKRKKRTKGTSRRRRRVGALDLSPSSPLVKFGPIVLGYMLSDKITKPIFDAVGAKIDPKLVAGGMAGLGAYLTFGGKPSTAKLIIGGIILGAGAKKLMSEFGIGAIGGYGDIPVIGGYGDIPVIGRRKVGAYTTHGSLGSYATHGSLGNNVMAGVMNGSGTGSGLNASSGYMN